MVIDRRIGAFLIDLLLISALSLIAFGAVIDIDVNDRGSREAAEAACELHDANDDPGFCLPSASETLVITTSRILSPLVFHIALWLLRGAVEGMTGWSPGKLLMGIRVVSAAGSKIGSPKGVLRTLLLPIDGFPWGAPMLIAMFVASNTQRQQRLGDIAAESFVVHKAAIGQFVTQPVALSTPLPVQDQPTPSAGRIDIAVHGGPVVFPSEPPLAPAQPPPPMAPPAPVRPMGMSYDESLQAYIWTDGSRTLIWDDSTAIWRDW